MPDLKSMSDQELLEITTKGMANKDLLEIAFRKKPVQPESLLQKAIRGIPPSPFFPVQDAVKVKELIDRGTFSDFPIGATVGGMGGAIVGAGTTRSGAGAIIGGGLGAGAGESVEQMIRRGLGLDAPETPLEAAKEIGKEVAIGAGAEFGGQLAIRFGAKALAPFKKTVSSEAEKVFKLFSNKTRRAGVLGLHKRISPLFPAQATNITERTGAAGILDFFHNIADNSIIGSSAMRRVAKQNIDVMSETVDDLIRSFSRQNLTSEQMGITLNAVLKENLKIERDASNVLYNTIDKLVKGKTITKFGPKIAPNLRTSTKVGIVDIGKIKNTEFIKNLQKLSDELSKFGSAEQGFDTVANVLRVNDNVSFEAAKNFRTSLMNIAKNRTIEGKTDPAVGLARKLAGQVDQAIKTALKKHSPKALKLWRKANRAYQAASEQYDNRLIREIFDMANRKQGGNPEDIINHVFKPGAITNVKRIKRAVDPETWGKVKNLFTRNLLKKSSIASEDLVSAGASARTTIAAADVKGGTFMLQGSQLKEALSATGKDILNTLYTPKELGTLKAVASAMDLSQKTVGHGLGRMFIQLSQAGAIIGVLSGKAAGLGLPLIVGPGVLSRVFTNPVTARWLIQGYKLPAGSPQLARVMARLSASLAEMEEKEVRKKIKTRNPRLAIVNQ